MIQPRQRSWLRPRFTLGALLVLILLCAVPLGYIAHIRGKNAARCNAWERLVAKGVKFNLDVSLPQNVKIIGIERGWWMELLNETPKFRSIEVLEGYSGGKPPAIFITDDELRLFAHFPEIETLKLTGVEHITDAGLGSLSALPKLRNFETNLLAQVDGSFLEEWAKSDTLETLGLMNMAKLKGETLAPIANMTRLKSITLFCCVYLDRTPLDAVNMPPQLIELRIDGTPITDGALARWLSQTQLRTLVLNTAFTRKIAPELRKQTQLSYFSVTNSPLIDDDLLFLGRCPALYNLAITGAPIDGSFLRRIPDQTQLDYLTLRAAPLKDEYVAELKRLRRLVHIELAWPPRGGDFLAGANWPMLQQCNLKGCRFSDEGKTNLTKLGALGRVVYPNNWSALDLRRYGSGKAPTDTTLSANYEAEAKANAIKVTTFESPTAGIPDTNRCPAELMGAVKELFDRAAAEGAELQVKAEH